MQRLIPILFACCLLSCAKQQEQKLFEIVESSEHGIDFQNNIRENDTINILKLEYVYNGGGVAAADFNNDGLTDLFFTGNMVPNKLYLNQGQLKFKDVSETAGIGASEKWKSGVAVADVNGDGLKDIYVCATIMSNSALRENMLFINQGIKDGVPEFKDEAKKYGVNYAGHSAGAAFLDYDNDGDLDLYIITNSIVKGVPTNYQPKINDGTVNADVLFRNNGDETFSDVSKEAGIVHEGYGLGLAIADINLDGWQDIYVSNDYITNDLMYINNHDGTFTNRIDESIRHQSQFSMGNDIADFNNDGFPDIVTLDMLPEGNLRRKTVISGNNYSSYINNKKYGYSPQYVRNMLQLNNGNGTFSEIGQLAGVHQTEWSWSPLFVDADNDGFKDLFITNGFPRDITDKDFANFRAESGTVASVAHQMDSIPVVRISNYAFRNTGKLTFEDVTKKWGISSPSFSNGASFADLDNDGDLDYIVNNINDNVLLYKNTLYDSDKDFREKHYLRIKLEGNDKNNCGLGAKVRLHYNGYSQYHDHSVYRGYISSVEDIVHFGLDTLSTIDTVSVEWPDGRINFLTNVKTDQVLKISYRDSQIPTSGNKKSVATILTDVTTTAGLTFVHQEDDKIDFNLQRTLPHKFSQSGPGLSVGDVNADGFEDLYISGSAGHNGTIFLQTSKGTFSPRELIKSGNKKEEDQGSLFFDADSDGDLDLYVVSGTFEYQKDSPYQQDRLYINDGKGNFKIDASALPSTISSGSCVRAADVDADGDLDLFVGGRVIPAEYPFADNSYLLINEGGKFTDKTTTWTNELRQVGMITDALWTDYNNDSKVDLLLAGEFMPLTLFRNEGNRLVKLDSTGLENFSGWWNSLAAADFDKDGDIDYVAGNLGLNNYYKASDKTPVRIYAKDFDGNASVDAVLSCYLLAEDGTLQEFPVHFWEELNSQSPKFRRKFKYFKQYGRTTMEGLLPSEERKEAKVLVTNFTSSSFIENMGNEKFRVSALPIPVQTAPVNGIVTGDVNADGAVDILMVGNDYGNEIFTGRHDAFNGAVLLNDGSGKFTDVTLARSGFRVDKDAKALVKLSTTEADIFVASQNQDSIKVFTGKANPDSYLFTPSPFDSHAELVDNTGRKYRMEFYYGSGYLSQSTRRVRIPKNISEFIVYDYKGNKKVNTIGNQIKSISAK